MFMQPDQNPTQATRKYTVTLFIVSLILTAEVTFIWIFNIQGVLPGPWGTIFASLGTVLAVVVPTVHMLMFWHYSHEQLKRRLPDNGQIYPYRQGRGCFSFFSFMMITLLLTPFFWFAQPIALHVLSFQCSPAPSIQGIGVTKGNIFSFECIGISDGTFIFDTNRPSGDLKRQAANKKVADIAEASRLWREAVASDPGDAEGLIYQENQRVENSGRPYITLVVGTILSGNANAIDIGRSILQGAYTAQKDYNDQAWDRHRMLVRLLVANAGSDPTYTTTVAQQIVVAVKAAAGTEHPIVGVIGWPFSDQSINASAELAKAHIALVSPTATGDALTDTSVFFFRVSPPDKGLVRVATQYAERSLHASRIVLFFDSQQDESQDIEDDLGKQLKADGKTVVASEQYSSDQLDKVHDLLNDALRHNLDLIYYFGGADGLSNLLAHLPTKGKSAHLQVMAVDLFDELSSLSNKTIGYNRLHFALLASSDIAKNSPRMAAFLHEYAQDFGSKKLHPDSNVILSYDAMLALLRGCDIALRYMGSAKNITPDSLQRALTQITGYQAVLGASGRISFGTDGDPIDKAIMIVHIDKSGHIQVDEVARSQG